MKPSRLHPICRTYHTACCTTDSRTPDWPGPRHYHHHHHHYEDIPLFIAAVARRTRNRRARARFPQGCLRPERQVLRSSRCDRLSHTSKQADGRRSFTPLERVLSQLARVDATTTDSGKESDRRCKITSGVPPAPRQDDAMRGARYPLPPDSLARAAGVDLRLF